MKQRALAVVGAVALIVVAVVVRGSLLGGSDEGGGSGTSKGKPVVACTPDLAPVCAGLVADGVIASNPPELDLSGATAPPADVDGWITWDPAPAIANIDAPNTWGSSVPVGTATVAVGARRNASLPLPAGCTTNALTWTCVARAAQAGTPTGVGSARTAGSLARLYPLARTLVPDDGDFTTIDATTLKAIVNSPTDPQQDFPDQLITLQTKLGALTALVGPAGGLEAAGGLTVATPTPAATVTVVLASRPGEDLGDLDGALEDGAAAKALDDAGVTVGQGRLAPDTRAGELYVVRKKVG